MNVENDRQCFVCGPENATGLQVVPVADPERDEATITLAIPQRFQGWRGIVHGGILSTLFDEAAIYACLHVAPRAVTAEIGMRYLKPVPVETPVVVRARLVERRKRRLQVEGEVLVDGAVHARGRAVVMVLPE